MAKKKCFSNLQLLLKVRLHFFSTTRTIHCSRRRLSYVADGLYADAFLQSLQAVTDRQEYDPEASSDGVVRASKSRPGEFKKDRGGETRSIPEMSWACGGCQRLTRKEVDAPKMCGGCRAVYYCGKGRAIHPAAGVCVSSSFPRPRSHHFARLFPTRSSVFF